ncbi:potassium transporter 7 [Edwardsiella piscicida]|nr:potassium transporter 7 [Edwardsiella piscicida]AOP42907.1 potassium transporter 7 [Edwardsiella piscicida]EKS7767248.1 potassium transporter 7 [Edwardsiella piscicida]EKS7794451.1 potassium transporter 7 [Edwardsiella piscicida]EKS7811688.1 potassium transporter 7 [Edwardsiella piscicida]ELM3729380.1 potassium transporter 7 [Edwardsiella piscicida]
MKTPPINGLYGYKLSGKALRHPPGDPHGWAILLACLTVAGLALLLIHLL